MITRNAAPINDADLAAVKSFIDAGRPIPAVIVAALIARLEDSERGFGAEAPQNIISLRA